MSDATSWPPSSPAQPPLPSGGADPAAGGLAPPPHPPPPARPAPPATASAQAPAPAWPFPPPEPEGDDPPLGPPETGFPTVWRGYEPEAVDRYVEHVARTLHELESRAAPHEAVRRALDRVSEQTAGILRQAEEAAERITTRSRTQAQERLALADAEGQRIVDAAHERARALDLDLQGRRRERELILADVRRLGARMLSLADEPPGGRALSGPDLRELHEAEPKAQPRRLARRHDHEPRPEYADDGRPEGIISVRPLAPRPPHHPE